MIIERVFGRDPLYFIPRKIQTKLSLALVFFVGLYTLAVLNEARESLSTLCKLRGTTDLYQCWNDTAKSREAFNAKIDEAGGLEAFNKFQVRAAEDRHTTNEIQNRKINDARSRTRLAESEWDKPYHGPVTVPFADHSVTKIPDCPAGERATFSLNLQKPIPGGGLEFPRFGGYWLFDVFRQTAGGRVYPRSPTAGTLTTFCLPPVAAPQGGRP